MEANHQYVTGEIREWHDRSIRTLKTTRLHRHSTTQTAASYSLEHVAQTLDYSDCGVLQPRAMIARFKPSTQGCIRTLTTRTVVASHMHSLYTIYAWKSTPHVEFHSKWEFQVEFHSRHGIPLQLQVEFHPMCGNHQTWNSNSKEAHEGSGILHAFVHGIPHMENELNGYPLLVDVQILSIPYM